MKTRQHVIPGLRPTGPAGENPARPRQRAASGRKFGSIGPDIGPVGETALPAIVAGLSGIVADGRTVPMGNRAATPAIQPGNIVIKLDSKIAVLRYIPVRTPCVVSSVTHGEEPYYWLRDARTNAYIGGMCTELMMGFRKVRS